MNSPLQLSDVGTDGVTTDRFAVGSIQTIRQVSLGSWPPQFRGLVTPAIVASPNGERRFLRGCLGTVVEDNLARYSASNYYLFPSYSSMPMFASRSLHCQKSPR